MNRNEKFAGRLHFSYKKHGKHPKSSSTNQRKRRWVAKSILQQIWRRIY